MNHIPIPVDSLAHSPWQVPFLSSQDWTYDDQGFLTFPERAAVDTSQLLTKHCRFSLLEELAPFLQEWLWFGLLGETIGIRSGIQIPPIMTSRATFIAKKGDGTEIITSGELPRRYELCVRRALEIVNNILSRWPCAPDFTPSAVYLVLFSVQILCETLLTSREVLFPGRQLTPMSSFLRSQLTHIADISLIRACWCWSEIQGLPKRVVLRYYLGFMSRSPNWHNNRTCSGEGCALPPGPDHTFHAVHTTENCLCEEIMIDNDTIIKFTEQGSFPLLIFSEESNGKRQLTVLKHSLSAAPNFMAISHVRHLGLGSSTSNALPYCQLSRLQTLAASDEGVMPFWIDTICIPLPRKARKAALLHARDIFTAATTVLVVDPCLYSHAVGSATEALLYIKHSNWAKRLWTIQEGALARRLCFQFSNRVWSIDDILSEYERDRALDVLHLLPCKRGDSRAAGDDRLMQMLARLDSDMVAAESVLAHVEERFDQLKLKTVLRWGYLASPKFFWMVDEGEVWRLRVVVDVLEQVYAGGDAGVGETKPLLERLRFISAVDLN